MYYIVIVQVYHRLDELQHEALDLTKTKEALLLFGHQKVNERCHINLAVLKRKKDVLLLIANDHLLKLDNVRMWILHLAKLSQNRHFSQ